MMQFISIQSQEHSVIFSYRNMMLMYRLGSYFRNSHRVYVVFSYYFGDNGVHDIIVLDMFYAHRDPVWLREYVSIHVYDCMVNESV